MAALPLSASHVQMLRDGSGIIDQVIAERGYQTVDGPNGYTDLRSLGFSTAQAKLRPGLLLPLHGTDGTRPVTVYRPDKPRVDANGRIRKYLLPSGARMRIDCPPRCRPLLGDPHAPLWVTEGQKKADALASRGAVVLDLLGIWNFKGKNDFGGTTILVDLDYVAWNGREVRLVFDSDTAVWPQMRQALERLSEILRRKQAVVRVVALPGERDHKVGVDDYLVDGHTLQDLEALIVAPRPQPQPAPAQVALLDEAPACLRRPLALTHGRSYAAIWPHIQETRTETLDKPGQVVRLATPEVSTEQRLFVMRDDGVIFGDGGAKPWADLGLEVHLPEIPMPAKLWTTTAIKAYVKGARPDACQVFRDVVAVVDRFIDFDYSLTDQQTMAELVACFIMSTWFLDAFAVVPYLWPNGQRGSGKTQLLVVVAELAYLGQVILAGGSYASLRDLADYGATLAFDDAENVMDQRRGDPDKRALLLAGNRRGNTIPVKEPVNGRSWRTRHVQTFCPRLFSAIRLPDPVLASRTLIVPLIPTVNPDKANADPVDYRLWPTPRTDLVNNLWALALRHLADLQEHDGKVADTATLLGRTFEPWRAILAVASWLTALGVTDLFSRIEQLAKDYQKERQDLEDGDLTPLVIQALCEYGLDPGKYRQSSIPIIPVIPIVPIKKESADDVEVHFLTSAIAALATDLAKEQDNGPDAEAISARRVGRVFGWMRLQKVPRPAGNTPKGGQKPSRQRAWRASKGQLRQWLMRYHLDIPDEYTFASAKTPQPNGDDGDDGDNGEYGSQTPQGHADDAHPMSDNAFASAEDVGVEV